MLDQTLLDDLSTSVLHEFADVEENLEDELIEFIFLLTSDEKIRLAYSLRELADMDTLERKTALEGIQFAWDIDDESGFFRTLADVVDGMGE